MREGHGTRRTPKMSPPTRRVRQIRFPPRVGGFYDAFLTVPPNDQARTLLITAGPTQEPIDAVRFVSNRSSGRLGVEVADAAVRRGWTVHLLLGPVCQQPVCTEIRVDRFRTASELDHLLQSAQPAADVVVMAAAVADYRPLAPHATGKLRRSDARLTLELEPVPDLLAACARRRRSGQVLVGFALEPEDRLLDSARAKLNRKGVDAIVANPLETMESDEIRSRIVARRDGELTETDMGTLTKAAFADRLLQILEGWI